jgi:glycosyltransferase involved in cell wall biosynthesis
VDGRLVETLPGPYGQNGSPADWQLCEWINLCRAVERSREFDVMHSHAYLWGLPLQALSRCPLVHSLHLSPDSEAVILRQAFPLAPVVALSHAQWVAQPTPAPAAVIHHGIDVGEFTFAPEPQDYVLYLGRFISGKGPRVAVRAARAAGIRLILAGPRNRYFREMVEPLVDGTSVQFVGPVYGAERDRLIGGARAMLYPVQVAEPFGLVIIESMMCGTPVAAISTGAVAELVEEGVTGSLAADKTTLAAALLRAVALDRQGVRRRAVERFSAERMAREYEQLYRGLCEEGPPR